MFTVPVHNHMELKLSRQIDSDFYEPFHLFLYDAVLTWLCIGPTPVEICQMAKLEKLVLHGNQLTVFKGNNGQNTILTTDLKQGHALATGDLIGQENDQIVVGWREPNADGKVGIKLFVSQDSQGSGWKDYWIDDNGMACEDLLLADLDGDDRMDIIAAGRATNNLKIYWNKSK